jgi:Fe-S cluster biosynthesis and repair protein YggX
MTRMIFCTKLKQEAEGMDAAPYPGEMGQKIFAEISKQAWQEWLGQQTILINEYRLSMMDVKAREFLRTEMQNFLFGGGSSLPPQFTKP